MIRESNRKEFDQIGLSDMRKRIASSTFDANKLREAEEWLDEKEHGEERAFRRESSQTARSAKNAAWIAAIAAIVAAIAAVIAVLSSK